MTLHDRALSDIKVAKQLISPVGNPTGDEGIYDIAGYHVQQGIEKELKYILVEECQYQEGELKQIGHDIDALVDKVENETNIVLSDTLKWMASEITNWEAGTRYGSSAVVLIEDINNAIEEFETLQVQYQDLVEAKNDVDIQEDNLENVDAEWWDDDDDDSDLGSID